ncbi:hypothetical protein V3C99_013062 [Haemonchus contortus]
MTICGFSLMSQTKTKPAASGRTYCKTTMRPNTSYTQLVLFWVELLLDISSATNWPYVELELMQKFNLQMIR